MADIKNDTIAKLTGIREKTPTISDVKQQAENITVIDETIEAARKLAGTNTLEEELKRKDKRMQDLQKEKDEATEQLHETQIVNVKAELGAKIDHLEESLKGDASPKSISAEITEIKKAANELGMGGSKVSEIKEIMALVTSLNPKTNLADQVKEARDLLTALQPAEDKGKEGIVEGLPASAAIEIHRMENDTKIALAKMASEQQRENAKMASDQQRKDQEYQLTLRKHEEEILIRREKMQMDYSIKKEHDEMLSGGLQIIGRAAGKAYADALGKTPQGAAAQGARVGAEAATPKSFHIELNEGEAGTMECPSCKSPVGVGPETKVAECVGCHSKFEVVRVAPPIPSEEE